MDQKVRELERCYEAVASEENLINYVRAMQRAYPPIKNVSTKYEIPFDKDGNAVNYNGEYGENRENVIFFDAIEYFGYKSGYHGKPTFKFKNLSDNIFYLTLKEMHALLSEKRFRNGWITGFFTYKKRGKNYRLERLSFKQVSDNLKKLQKVKS